MKRSLAPVGLVPIGLVVVLPAFFCLVLAGCPAQGRAEKIPMAPQFESFRDDGDGVVEISGRAAGFAHVELINGASIIGDMAVTGDGMFRIRPENVLEPGEYRFVLRSTGKNGYSATSLQTLVVSIPGKGSGRALALVEEPGKARRLISDHTAYSHRGGPAERDFAIEVITFSEGKLTFCGRRPASMWVSVISGNRTIGAQYAAGAGRFCITRIHAMQKGDYIFRAELSDELGERVRTVSLPFSIKNAAGLTRQVYRAGQPVNTTFVRRGETLFRIARRVYGNSALAMVLFAANRDRISNPDEIHTGQELVVPPVEGEKNDGIRP